VSATENGARSAALQAGSCALPPGRGVCPQAGGAAPESAPSCAPNRRRERPLRPSVGGAGHGRGLALRGLLRGVYRQPARAPHPVHPGSAGPAAHPARSSPGREPRTTRSAHVARQPTDSIPRHRGGAPSWLKTTTSRRRQRGGAAGSPLSPPASAPVSRSSLRRWPHRQRKKRGPLWTPGPDALQARRIGGAIVPRRAACGWRAFPSSNPERSAAGTGQPG